MGGLNGPTCEELEYQIYGTTGGELLHPTGQLLATHSVTTQYGSADVQ